MKDWHFAILVILVTLVIFELRFGFGNPIYEVVVQEPPKYQKPRQPFLIAPNYRTRPFYSLEEALNYVHNPNASEGEKLRRAVALSIANSGNWETMQNMVNYGFDLETNIADLNAQGVHTVDQYEALSIETMSYYLADSLVDMNQPVFPEDLRLSLHDIHVLYYTNARHPYRQAFRDVYCVAFPRTAHGCEAKTVEIDTSRFI